MVVVFIVFFGLGMFLLSQKSDPNTIQTSADVMENVERNELSLHTQDGSMEYNVGDTVAVVVNGESSGHDINGFDILLSYNPEVAEFIDVNPGLPQFQVFAFTNPTYVAVTGTKLLTVSSSTVFAGDAMVTARFRLKAPGTAHFQINEQVENEHSKLVDMQANTYAVNAAGTLDLNVR